MTSHTNAIERDEFQHDAEGGAIVDSSAPLKVAGKNGATAVSARVNKVPAVREHRRTASFDARRALGERSRELQAFIAPLEDDVRRAHKYRAKDRRASIVAQGKVAELVLRVIREIAHRETGIFALEPHLPQLLSLLHAGSVEAGIVSGLVRRAQKAIAARDSFEREGGQQSVISAAARSGIYDVSRELDELTMLLKWFVRRKMSLASLELESLLEGHLLETNHIHPRDDQEVLYGVEVLHDHQMFGTKGCLVSAGLRLVGRDGQLLWLRVSVSCQGRAVPARPEWSTWSDPSGEVDEIITDAAAFCSLVPIRPNAQRVVVDEIRAFIPYAALNLPAGRCEVDFVISVVDGAGCEVLGCVKTESICVPQRELRVHSAPAPHTVGMWPHDVVSGDKISEFQVNSGFVCVAGWERHSVSVQFDLSLFMHAGESVMLECRFVDSKGEIVELSSLGIPFVASEMNVAVESVSSYRYRRVLHPKGAWAFYRGLAIDIPVEFLQLAPGSHELMCELVIASSDERILCGDMGRVTVRVPERDMRVASAGDNASSHDSTRDRAVVELKSIEVDPQAWFNGDDSIRVQATVVPSNSGQQLVDVASGRLGELCSPYRVEVSLEREDGHVLLQAFSDSLGMSFKPVTRAVCIEGYSGLAEQTIVTHFPKSEVLGWSVGLEGARVGTKLRLFARVAVCTPEGRAHVCEQREFFLRPLVTGGRKVVQIQAATPCVVDVVSQRYGKSSILSTQILLNIPAGDIFHDGITVQASLVATDGKRFELGKREIRPLHEAVWTRQQVGLSQYMLEFESPLNEAENIDSVQVEVVLCGARGDRLQCVRQPLVTQSLLRDSGEMSVDAAAPGEERDAGLAHEHDADELRVGTSKEKGLIAAIFSGFKLR